MYFSKIAYTEVLPGKFELLSKKIILLNIPSKELSMQCISCPRPAPVIVGEKNFTICGHKFINKIAEPATFISDARNGFTPFLLPDEYDINARVDYSFGLHLNDAQMNSLLPLCIVEDFEPFRNRKMSMNDPGYIGYRDEIHVYFDAISDSPYPALSLPMDYYYDEEHTWPSERLYKFLNDLLLEAKCEHTTPYGGLSLFLW